MNNTWDDIRKQEQKLERKVWAWLGVIGVSFILVNIFSMQTEAARDGLPALGLQPWITEFSSIIATLVLFPFLAIWTRALSFTPDTWRRTVFWLLLASVVFSFFHVSLMVGMRKIAFPVLLGYPYRFFGDLLGESLYEYRKDLGTYFLLIMALYWSRTLAQQASELQEMRAAAKKTGQITLKSGARLIRLYASDFVYAEAAGNYVDVFTNAKQYLARSSLIALQKQLLAAGLDVRQVHRTRLVNMAGIAEFIPQGSGDVTLVLQDGTRLRASRRYRKLFLPSGEKSD
ncbi:hypothetical protein MNBD_ALPHA06-579 [hydrothermal vent metagenome]|uniref:HTH LytTR-type domain-containing protein n=1 Tax=hydrothermal vent metagenome TaxID=652676 RepID=A0A3B0RL95_9ZZZZ